MSGKLRKVALVGSPNVGKSAIFNYLTSRYVTVSNYPGTTVDVSRGELKIEGKKYEVIDTPGIYALIPLTDEERVTRQLIFCEQPDLVVHVADAKNIRRMLLLTLQLLDAGLPVILNLNMIDESQKLGIRINTRRLSDVLGIPVNTSSAVKKYGLDTLKKEIVLYQAKEPVRLLFSDDIEQAITLISSLLQNNYNTTDRMAALLLLQGDEVILNSVSSEPDFPKIIAVKRQLAARYNDNLDYILTVQRQVMVDNIIGLVMNYTETNKSRSAEKIGRLTREPITGIPILILVLYFGLYMFVGQFGAGYLVDYIDENIFKKVISPLVQAFIYQHTSVEWLQSLIVGEYGIFSLGFRYAAVIILPIVGTFFLAFAILEDCGYLPRLALLVDRLFKNFGLNGRAVIPLTLGLGCGTMAVMVTRTLESRRERILATFLLSLTIPCSAQLGLVLAIISGNSISVAIWAMFVGLVFIIVGWLAARLMPGGPSAFYMEIPPLRMPIWSNIIIKAYTRMSWYFIEILPVFIITSVLLWIGDQSGILSSIIAATEPAMTLLGLPKEAAQAFLLGFFRRDYGAAGLYDMCTAGLLNDAQLLVAAITLTLFVPCVAQLVVMVKERGIFVSMIMILLIIGIAFSAGMGIHWMLTLLGGIWGY
ncbi:Fe(2+) transporter FeoB [bioreactor metagenome]|uniref:Ferrous iron transport protein B n=1 Tax=bioreactor metagenome TaxID=1076179 RepID=A0A644T2E7_9ZZZZ